MAPPGRLYERAGAPAPVPLGPLWHLDGERTCFIGPLTYNAPHQHGAPVFLAGLYGAFGVRIAGGAWRRCRTAVIPAGVVHELNVGGDPIGVLYIEPTLAGAAALAALTASTEETDGALVGTDGEIAVMRELWESAGSVDFAGVALDDLLGFATRHARRHMDPRIALALAALENDADGPAGVAQACAQAGLSPSRFQHLFTREVGVPYRRYRAWRRMRAAIAAVADGASFTHAAHEAGFFDQAHFGHDFRRTFGAPPSWSLDGVRLSKNARRRIVTS
jgi:AraC-like DNA-binding protein